MAYIGRQLARGENKLFDDISSSFNGSTTTFNLTVSSVATATATAYQLFVSLGGVMQKPNTDFTTAGNQITFTTAPAAGLSCWIMMQGDTIDQAAIPDASVTPSKIAGSGDFAFPADIRLKDADGSHYVGFQAPTTVSTNKVWTLPAADGSASQYLQTNGSGVLTWASVTIGGASGIDFNDNVKARWGTGNDLEVFHNGSNSVINDAGTGDLLLQVGGSTKATVSSTGLAVTGALTVSTNATITGDLTVSGTTTTINTQTLDVEDKNVVIGKVSSPSDTTADGGGWTLKGATDKTFNWVNATDAWTSSEHIHLIDDKKLLVGTGSDLQIYHDSNNSTIESDTGYLKITGKAGDVYLQSDSDVWITSNNAGETMAKFTKDGAATLYHNNSAKVETTSGGINVTGAINVNGAALSTSPTFTATASGAIAAGDPLIVNTNGTVSKPAQTLNINNPPTIGTVNNPYGTVTGNQNYMHDISYDSTTKRVVCVYQNGGSGTINHGSTYDIMGVIGTVTTGGITWGTPAVVHSANSNTNKAKVAAGNGRFLVLYNSTSNWYIKICTITAGTTTFSVSSEKDPSINTSGQKWGNIIYHPAADRFVCHTRNNGNNEACGWVIEVTSNTACTFGSQTVWKAQSTDGNDWPMAYDPDNEKIIFAMKFGSELLSAVGTVSGNSISFGSTTVVTTNIYSSYYDLCYDTNVDRVVAVYLHTDEDGYAKVGTVGSTVSWGSESEWNNANTPGVACEFISATNQVLIVGRFENLTGSARCIAATATTTALTYGTSKTLSSSNDDGGADFEVVDIPDVGVAVATYTKSGNPGDNVVYSNTVDTGNISSTMTTENFVGFSNAAISDGNTATIQIHGAVNENQSSLTIGQKYYVQQDGTLGLAASSPSVEAGIAIAATKLLVKG